MKKWLQALLVFALVLAIAPAALAAGTPKAKPGTDPSVLKFQCTGAIVSVDDATSTFAVKVKTMSSRWKGAKATLGKEVTIAVNEETDILLRELAASGKTSKARTLAFADLKPNRAVNVRGEVAVAVDGSGQLTATRVVMFVRTCKFQGNGTIVSVAAASSSFLLKIKTMSRNWNGWKKDKGMRGKQITIVVSAATKIFTRQPGADSQAVVATFADLAPNNRVHVGGKVVAADDGSNQFAALRIMEFLPAPPKP